MTSGLVLEITPKLWDFLREPESDRERPLKVRLTTEISGRVLTLFTDEALTLSVCNDSKTETFNTPLTVLLINSDRAKLNKFAIQNK